MPRSSSVIAAFTSCMGSVPSPANRWGRARTMSAISSFVARAVATAAVVSR